MDRDEERLVRDLVESAVTPPEGLCNVDIKITVVADDEGNQFAYVELDDLNRIIQSNNEKAHKCIDLMRERDRLWKLVYAFPFLVFVAVILCRKIH
jgi:hypothetical protein